MTTFADGHTAQITDVQFSPNGNQIDSSSINGSVKLWKVGVRTGVTEVEAHIGAAHSVAFSRDGRIIASSGADATIKLWKIEDGITQKLIGHKTLDGPSTIQSFAEKVALFCDAQYFFHFLTLC